MKHLFKIFIAFFFISSPIYAQEVDSSQLYIDQIEASLKYEYGEIELENGNAVLNVPEGFRFLNKEQSAYVLSDLWENPNDESVLGLLVPEHRGVMDDNAWLFAISFDEMGYVEDDDADDIDYDELLEEQQEEIKEGNASRIESGYRSVELIGWASRPYYDKEKKILHWAKELKFGDSEANTLNYDMRILGRKGVFILQAVSGMGELTEVKKNTDKIIRSVTFKEGHQYSDFIPGTDTVAAWSIGGLVAGKLLAKAGFFALLLKFWKVIAVGFVAFGATIKKFFTGGGNEEQTS